MSQSCHEEHNHIWTFYRITTGRLSTLGWSERETTKIKDWGRRSRRESKGGISFGLSTRTHRWILAGIFWSSSYLSLLTSWLKISKRAHLPQVSSSDFVTRDRWICASCGSCCATGRSLVGAISDRPCSTMATQTDLRYLSTALRCPQIASAVSYQRCVVDMQ